MLQVVKQVLNSLIRRYTYVNMAHIMLMLHKSECQAEIDYLEKVEKKVIHKYFQQRRDETVRGQKFKDWLSSFEKVLFDAIRENKYKNCRLKLIK